MAFFVGLQVFFPIMFGTKVYSLGEFKWTLLAHGKMIGWYHKEHHTIIFTPQILEKYRKHIKKGF
jgi:Leu/Phe-tRNA-protein transferase